MSRENRFARLPRLPACRGWTSPSADDGCSRRSRSPFRSVSRRLPDTRGTINFITLRASRNLVEGHDLDYNVGERVHTFTSPLSVLMPARLTRVSCCGSSGFSTPHCLRSPWGSWGAAPQRLGATGRTLLFGLLIGDAKLTDFSINGMETALLVFFMLLLWSELESSDRPRVMWLALASGGLMWTRPDAFILAGAMITPHLIFSTRRARATRPAWPSIVRGARLGGVIYLPWAAWAWWYYGTPVPHTIIAKGAVTPPAQLMQLLRVPWRVPTESGQLFLPTHAKFGGWPDGLVHVGHALSVLASFAWLVPGWSPAFRRTPPAKAS